MLTRDVLLAEFDREMALTRALLDRIPEDRFAWRPHPRSMSLGELATHLTHLYYWGLVTLREPSIDMAGQAHPPVATTRTELLSRFDAAAAGTRAAVVDIQEAQLTEPWALRQGDRTLFTMPRLAVWRSFVMNHLVHHRGQLSVYLRLIDVLVPSIYGPSADEAPRF
jgi:uncharacterized damage-inducible protein DinB